MFRKRRSRRIVGAVLVVTGVLLMWLAPESPAGIALLAAGVGLEAIGLHLERSRANRGDDSDATPR
jgi:uncharacterized membrane protein YidH (DUF202 family)